MDSRFVWDDLVLPQSEAATLRAIASQLRTTINERSGPGISALFAGPPGTGKTMAAQVLAGDLNLALYRIDLSSLVSKFIGETEKNLRGVFEAAEQGGAILLFDEADALFGKRSEVEDSHDRFADVEAGFLLQQMEAFRGLTILASNGTAPLDPELLRCLTFVVQFPFR
jgi:SpoVK/Ycf46/Vps4 family AAA+-type ATPase